MKLKTVVFAVVALLLIPPAAFCAAPSAKEAGCAAEDMQIFYYYLDSSAAKVENRVSNCHEGKDSVLMPSWLKKALPAMRKRMVWKDPEQGELSEAALWQAPVSILYELADKITKTGLPTSEANVPAADMETELNDIRIRFLMSTDRLARAGLESSFEGRGASLMDSMNSIMAKIDGLTDAMSSRDLDRYYADSEAALKLSRGLFAQLFEKPKPAAGKKFVPKYKPEARIFPGYRGITLPVSGSQALFLSAGDRVDMLVTFEAIMAGNVKEKVTATILQNVVVLKVHKPDTPDGTGVIQMLVNPVEAQYASLSLAQGSNIVISRRAEGDTEMHPMEIASFRKLFK